MRDKLLLLLLVIVCYFRFKVFVSYFGILPLIYFLSNHAGECRMRILKYVKTVFFFKIMSQNVIICLVWGGGGIHASVNSCYCNFFTKIIARVVLERSFT